MRVKVSVNTSNPLTIGFCLPRDNNNDTWIKFRYERLQDFCYRCGRIGHFNNKCSFEPMKGVRQGTGSGQEQHQFESPRPLAITSGERRCAGVARTSFRFPSQQCMEDIHGNESMECVNDTGGHNPMVLTHDRGK